MNQRKPRKGIYVATVIRRLKKSGLNAHQIDIAVRAINQEALQNVALPKKVVKAIERQFGNSQRLVIVHKSKGFKVFTMEAYDNMSKLSSVRATETKLWTHKKASVDR